PTIADVPDQSVVLGGVVALGLSAVQFIPFLELLFHSSRRLVLDPSFAAQFSIPFAQLAREVFLPQWNRWNPGLQGDPAMVYFYIGPIALGLALHALARGAPRARRLGIASIIFIFLSLGKYIPGYRFLFFLHFFRSQNNWLLLASCALALLGAAGIASLRKYSWKWLAVGAVALDLMIFAQPSKSAWGTPEFLTDTPALIQKLSHIPRARIYHEEHLMRTWGQGTLNAEEDYLLMKDFLAPSYGMAFGIGDIANYQTLQLKTAEQYRRRLSEPDAPSSLLNSAGASAVVSLAPQATRVERKHIRALMNPDAKPHIFILEGSGGTLRMTEDRSGYASAVVDVPQPAMIVFSEADYPGWRVLLNGREIPRELFDGIFMAARIPAGRHHIVFKFNPLSFWLGLALTLGTLYWILSRFAVKREVGSVGVCSCP
ncbi:MAG: YfhO family protein, partial [Elusimicrobiota bacterium]